MVKADTRMRVKRLVVSDIDGTLVGDREVITEETTAVLDRCAADEDVTFVLATGMPVISAMWYVDLTGAEYVIAFNGAAVCGADRAPLRLSDGIRPDMQRDMVRLAERHDVSLTFDTLALRYAVTAIDCAVKAMGIRHGIRPERTDVAAIREPVLKAQFLGDPRALAAVQHALPAGVAASGGTDHYGSYLEVAPGDTTKGSAVRFLADRLGLSSVLAIGDGRNDVEMVAQAGQGVAVMGAVPELIAAATHRVHVRPNDGAVGVALAALLYREPWALRQVQRTDGARDEGKVKAFATPSGGRQSEHD